MTRTDTAYLTRSTWPNIGVKFQIEVINGYYGPFETKQDAIEFWRKYHANKPSALVDETEGG